jgi:hypothetical protein
MAFAISALLSAAPTFSDWGVPVNLGPVVNSSLNDEGPAISKDGLSLFFGSNRLGSDGLDIWVSQRASLGDPWGPPTNLGSTINTPFIENVPALSRDEHWLFFNSNRPEGGFGDVDVWVAWRANPHDDFGWHPPVNLGSDVNTASFDGGPAYLENDEAGAPLLFFTSNRPGGPDFDIRVSERAPDGSFGPSMPVSELNSPFNDGRPSVRFDGLEVFLHSTRIPPAFDLWVSTRGSVFDAWSTPISLGPTVNTVSRDFGPYIASDRRTLYFASDRPDGFGGTDLYVTTRTKVKSGQQ